MSYETTNLTIILTVLSAAKHFCDNNHHTSKTKQVYITGNSTVCKQIVSIRNLQMYMYEPCLDCKWQLFKRLKQSARNFLVQIN